jgi:hypothetical protein
MDPVVEKLLADAEKALEAERAAGQPASPAPMDLELVVEKAVQKALSESREGTGRVSQVVEKGAAMDSDPVAYLVKKAGEVDFDDPFALKQDEKDLIVGFWNATFWGDPNPVIAEESAGRKRR